MVSWENQVHNLHEAAGVRHGEVGAKQNKLRFWVGVGIENNLNFALTRV